MTRECKVCGRDQSDRPAIFKNEDWCCENHRKMLRGGRG